jgi:hypothetical protein
VLRCYRWMLRGVSSWSARVGWRLASHAGFAVCRSDELWWGYECWRVCDPQGVCFVVHGAGRRRRGAIRGGCRVGCSRTSRGSPRDQGSIASAPCSSRRSPQAHRQAPQAQRGRHGGHADRASAPGARSGCVSDASTDAQVGRGHAHPGGPAEQGDDLLRRLRQEGWMAPEEVASWAESRNISIHAK